jgi:hypothetical protein
VIREIWAALKRHYSPKPMDKIEALDLRVPVTMDRAKRDAYLHGSWELPDAKQVKAMEADFAVTASPRHIPWSRRKKELEAAARHKRRQYESFREQA